MQNHSAIVVAVTCAASLASIVPATSHAQLSSKFQVYASGFNGNVASNLAGTDNFTSAKPQPRQLDRIRRSRAIRSA
jgi:hypothetical protein